VKERRTRLGILNLADQSGTGIALGQHVSITAKAFVEGIVKFHRAVVVAADDLDFAIEQHAQVCTHTRDFQRVADRRECASRRVEDLPGKQRIATTITSAHDHNTPILKEGGRVHRASAGKAACCRKRSGSGIEDLRSSGRITARDQDSTISKKRRAVSRTRNAH